MFRIAEALPSGHDGGMLDSLDRDGFAVIPDLLSRHDVLALRDEFDDVAKFRSTVVMERHGYGRGTYRYFKYPLPPVVQALRERIYAMLAPAANDWSARLGFPVRYPATLGEMIERCGEAGQQRPTAILLRYGPGDYNALHQDLYGDVTFPFQATLLLSEPGREFTGGEFVLYEGKPRRQSVARVVPLGFGDCVVIPNRYKPNLKGGRSTFRHGVSVVTGGSRTTLGVIMHDAR